MLPAKSSPVTVQKSLHNLRDRLFAGFQKKMEMIQKKAIGDVHWTFV
jgi:hypothetical protein